jgi:methionyl aminopeptidase
MREGYRIGDVGAAVEDYCTARGYGVVWEYTGHGVGRALHEDPSIPNLGPAGHGARLRRGMTLAIEPMINLGTGDVEKMNDGWTVLTADRKRSAHYENTVLITDGDPVILTTED